MCIENNVQHNNIHTYIYTYIYILYMYDIIYVLYIYIYIYIFLVTLEPDGPDKGGLRGIQEWDDCYSSNGIKIAHT